MVVCVVGANAFCVRFRQVMLSLIQIAIWIVSALYVSSQSVYADVRLQNLHGLSPQQIEGFKTGKGMGMAKPAEMNQFPGPRHVLDLAAELKLSAEQIQQTHQVFNRMQSDAKNLGLQLLEKEVEIEVLFSRNQVKSDELKQRLQEASRLQADLRFVHLNAHLQQQRIMTVEQIEQYDILRGYKHDGEHADQASQTRAQKAHSESLHHP